MPLTPQITLTAKLQDVTGSSAGSVASPAVLRIALCGFGLTLPCIVGTSNLAQVGPEDFYDTGTGISTKLWGNDVISPAGTYYAITILDGNGNILQCGMYQFTGDETIDLSSAPQIVAVNTVEYVACAGAFPGTVYVSPGIVIGVAYNGVLQRPGIDYNLSGGNKTIALTFATFAGDTVYALCSLVVGNSLIPAAAPLVYEVCAGAIPGTVYTAPAMAVAVLYNGVFMRPTIDYSVADGTLITLTFETQTGDTVYALCL